MGGNHRRLGSGGCARGCRVWKIWILLWIRVVVVVVVVAGAMLVVVLFD